MSFTVEIKAIQKEVPKSLGPVNQQIKRVLWKDLEKWGSEIYSKWKNQHLNDYKNVSIECQPQSFLIIRGEYVDKIPEKEIEKDWHNKYFPWLYQKIEYNQEAQQIINTYSKKLNFITRKLLNRVVNTVKNYFKEKTSLTSRAVTFAYGGIVIEISIFKNNELLFHADNQDIYQTIIGENHE